MCVTTDGRATACSKWLPSSLHIADDGSRSARPFLIVQKISPSIRSEREEESAAPLLFIYLDHKKSELTERPRESFTFDEETRGEVRSY